MKIAHYIAALIVGINGAITNRGYEAAVIGILICVYAEIKK